MNYRALCFDLDGTLIDSLPDIVRSVNALRRERGLTTITRGHVIKGVGRGVEYLLQHCLPPLVDATLILRDIGRYQEIYSASKSIAKPFPYVRRGLTLIRNRYPSMKWAVVTNKPTRLARETLAAHLTGFEFDQIRGPETVSFRKPNKAHLLETLKQMNVAPHECIYIGDDPVDVELGQNSVCDFIGAAWGYGGLTAQKYPALTLCNSFEDFVIRLEQMMLPKF